MIDLSTIPEEILIARGQYSTIRATHEDSKKALQIECGNLLSLTSHILRKMQPENGLPDNPGDLILQMHTAIERISTHSQDIRELAEQKEELKQKAWPK